MPDDPKAAVVAAGASAGSATAPGTAGAAKCVTATPKPAADDAIILERKATAERFYQSKGWPADKIAAHMKGIDFSQPVEVTTLERPTVVSQWQKAGNPQGNYFAPPGTNPSTLGIDVGGRVETKYDVQQPVQVLKSTAAEVPDWRGSGTIFKGGGTQYFTTESTAFRPLK